MKMSYSFIAKALVVASLALSVTAVWAERPKDEVPACTFTGGAYYKSNNTLYLESFAKEKSSVAFTDKDVKCINNNGFNSSTVVVVERDTELKSHSTIMMPIPVRIKSKSSSCITIADPVKMVQKSNGKYEIQANPVKNFDKNRPQLMLLDTTSSKCADIKEIYFAATGSKFEIGTSNTYYWFDGNNHYTFTGTYSYKKWAAGDSELGKIYGYAAKKKSTVAGGQFVKVGSGAFVPPLRAYLKYTGGRSLTKKSADAEEIAELPEEIDVVIAKNDSTMSIGKLNTFTGELKMEGCRFDLNGRAVGEKPANHAVYVDKKKVVR